MLIQFPISIPIPRSKSLLLAIQIRQAQPMLLIICMNQALAIAHAPSRRKIRVTRSSGLHGASGLDRRDDIGGDAVLRAAGAGAMDGSVAIGVAAGDVEEVDAGEDDEEAGEEGECVDGV